MLPLLLSLAIISVSKMVFFGLPANSRENFSRGLEIAININVYKCRLNPLRRIEIRIVKQGDRYGILKWLRENAEHKVANLMGK